MRRVRKVALLPLPLPLALAALVGCGESYLNPLRGPDGGATGGGTGGGATGGGAGGAGSGGAVPIECPTTLVGYASLGPTTGGGGGDMVTVSTLAELIDYAGRTQPYVIVVDGPPIVSTGQIEVTSNKTIVGGPNMGGTLLGVGLILNPATNVIIRNLTISKVQGQDAILVQKSANVWIDHCDLSSDRDHGVDFYDGLVDVTHASDNVTVSWTVFHDHFKASLVGHSNTNAAEDTGHLTVTYHHNDFRNITAYGPRVRFGRGHVFNNFYQNVSEYAVGAQLGAVVRVERNVFRDVASAIVTRIESGTDDGAAANIENELMQTPVPVLTLTDNFEPLYQYTADSPGSVPLLVVACAGPGKIPVP
jgi:pectate lyase